MKALEFIRHGAGVVLLLAAVATPAGAFNLAPGVWRPELSEMRNLELNETTLISFATREVSPDLKAEIFTKDSLEPWTGE